ncbi:Endonuclease/exonuclease/phosphatase [Dendrothele bispora CBS 962.96]|uniref:Endonuclease/exonuclease/phosphatase n=1 Tax=Dendrothele bispora (strain CBS 962.96) TaxID=1314807 RepID=A0A4S8MPY6_DENBC|nr:Endonuclease/exonuclease/phosphatase [Dendrothele bispora CBS 962.96]
MASKRPSLTLEQIALSEARKAKRLRQEQAPPPSTDSEKGKIVQRQWLKLQDPPNMDGARRIKVFTWNLLAQCLVRRELFPTSDCLKANQREHMLYRELLSQDADILCLQEVDRLEKLVPVLQKAGYSHCYASGPRKKHGCLIAFKKDTYQEVGKRLVNYDDEDIRFEGSELARKGASFRTKNIGHIVALKSTKDDFNLVVATTHLFWHPRYTYERARQAGILKREAVRFREQLGGWPCIISGDFNFAPDDAGYSLAVGDPLLPKQEEDIRISQVVHATIDPTVTSGSPKSAAQDENEEETDPDRSITNARSAKPADGLLSCIELHDLFKDSGPPLKSMYDLGMKKYASSDDSPNIPLKFFGDRVSIAFERHGAHEPQWTSYTHYWKTVLDYIFIIDTPSIQSSVTGILSPHRTEDLNPGLPRQGVCASDHVSLSAEVTFVPQIFSLNNTVE